MSPRICRNGMNSMLRIVKSAMLALALAGAASTSQAFSLLGPFDGWQVGRIGYNLPFNGDIGGPMTLGEEYRWNIRTVTYGFDPSFLDYFGARGVEEVRKAVAILNGLPPISKMSADLSEFPQNTRRINYEASALQMIDLKTIALGVLVEEVGLASPERYTWTLRDLVETPRTYWVTRRNYDPVTWQQSVFVNGTLYTYGVFEFPSEVFGLDWADAVEFGVDPLAIPYTSVASLIEGLHGGYPVIGEYVTGLTRDDVGGLRYLYRPNNYNVESPIPGLTRTGGVPGSPVDPSATNNTVATALRPGVDKITFVEAKFESGGFGNFIAITNRYVDYYFTNNVLVKTTTERAQLFAPDILFSAADIGPGGQILRTDTSGWTNNTSINGSPAAPALAGPGVINPTAVITFGKTIDVNVNTPLFLYEHQVVPGYVWGAFDGTTNRPFLFPDGATIQDLENRVLGR